jgi:hypothetical protein
MAPGIIVGRYIPVIGVIIGVGVAKGVLFLYAKN